MPKLKLRTARAADIDQVNQVIFEAIGTWRIADRVRELSRHAYRYDESDLEHGELRLLVDASDQTIGIAHWDQATPADTPVGSASAAILHGLYLMPAFHGQGLGRQLLSDAINRASHAGHDALALRAQRDAEPFFLSQGFVPGLQESSPPLYPRRLSIRLNPDRPPASCH